MIISATDSEQYPTNTNQTNLQISKPDDETYWKQLEDLNNTIDKLKEELVGINEKINNSSESGTIVQKREELRSQLDRLRGKQAEKKQGRLKTYEQIKNLSETQEKKKRTLKAAQEKLQYRTIKEIDSQILKLEKQIESGNLKIVEEKRFISEISSLKRSKKTVEECVNFQLSIDSDEKAIKELRSSIDDKEFRETNAQYEKILAELDSISKDHASDKEKRNELFEERKRLRDELTTQISDRKAMKEDYNRAKQKYKQLLDEERRRRFEMNRKKREERDEQKRSEIVSRMREEAEIPAFQEEILICENLINYFQTQYGTGKPTLQADTNLTNESNNNNNNIRQPDVINNIPEGTLLVKKSDREEDYFGRSKSSKKTKIPKEKKSNKFNLSLKTMEQLISFKVTVPLNVSDVDKTINELKEKKDYFVENQDLEKSAAVVVKEVTEIEVNS
ncbi:1365_t:CDS:2 [Diversispora eburnea]|uniref:1365_t:CDS:1 n=1 Tax=Diversispora eburnea TaxID=1213867 RepID=A0A9N8UWN9_9GLOM|nr:1365_t:CDS:2 [Diversispora eburnea]